MTPTASHHIPSILYIPPYPVSGISNPYARTSLRLVYYCMHIDPPLAPSHSPNAHTHMDYSLHEHPSHPGCVCHWLHRWVRDGLELDVLAFS